MEVGGAASKAVHADSKAGGAAIVVGGAALQAPHTASMVPDATKQVARVASVRGGPASEEGDAAMEVGGAATVEGDAARTQQQLPAGWVYSLHVLYRSSIAVGLGKFSCMTLLYSHRMDSATSFLLKIHLLGNRKKARKDVKCFSFEMVVDSNLSNYKDFIDSVTEKYPPGYLEIPHV
jgi:hypothetical protein